MDDGIEMDGSNLSGVSGQCVWEDASCKTGADSTHQGAARLCGNSSGNASDDNKENDGSVGRRHTIQSFLSCDGLCLLC